VEAVDLIEGSSSALSAWFSRISLRTLSYFLRLWMRGSAFGTKAQVSALCERPDVPDPGPMNIIERFTAAEMQLRSPPAVTQAA
jgi:hypothetical protein